jgi:hypothetical protein
MGVSMRGFCFAPYCAIALLTLAGLSGCAQVKSSLPLEPHMSPNAALATTTAQGALGTELSAAFDYAPASRIIEVRYSLRNGGDAALAVFDRGDQHAVGVGRQVFGAVGIPRMEVEGEDVSLVHAAVPLSDPAPTSPPTPIAIELAPGATLEGDFKFALKGLIVPKRLRWCVGVMRMGDAYMDSPQDAKGGKLWRASFGVVEKQTMVCTPWYDVESARFEA